MNQADKDGFGRSISYLRISVTDRCNLRCVYCMPEEGVKSKTHEEILSFEEMASFVEQAAQHGIANVRLTGGEPLVRLGLPEFVGRIKSIEGIEDVALTTNGILLPKYAAELKEAGLDRVNISLDTLDPDMYRRITRRGDVHEALAAIDAALAYGFDPVKVNTVVVRSLNQDIFEFAKLSIDRPLHVRFIEYMPVGASTGIDGQGWSKEESVPSQEIIDIISRRGEEEGIGPLIPLAVHDAPGGAGPARYHAFVGAKGTVGTISPVSNHFCSQCNRLRLTADGKLRPCLFSDTEIDVRAALRVQDTQGVHAAIADALKLKPESHNFREGTARNMSQIGG